MNIIKKHWGVLLFTLLYLVPFTTYYISTGDAEFIWYAVIVIALLVFVIATLPKSQFPEWVLWALSFWTLLHLAGGGIPVGDTVLYGYQLLPVYDGGGEMVILKYDQLIHAYGFAVSAYIVFHFLKHYTTHPYRLGVYIIAVLGSMGLGVVNEIAEFSAVVLFEDTGVGGYVNTSLDLIFNTLGAVLAMVLVHVWHKRREGRSA